jgi:hypothetical protein
MAGAAFRAGWFLSRNAGDARRKNGETRRASSFDWSWEVE